MKQFVYIVTAYDMIRGKHIVGVFDNDQEADDVACAVLEPWVAMYEQFEIGKAHLPPRLP